MALPKHQRNRIDQFSGDYPITVGRTYLVGGMMISEGRLLFLVRDDEGDPVFVPAAFFDVVAREVPKGWMFSLAAGNRIADEELWNFPVSALWGYPEFVREVRHIADLGEGDSRALAVFDRYLP
ncbi:hypothetical protein [Microlunatus speluncae]|uniref:hypothetical protein n=1 Tax=Microlunatus speluncae TaxID=2594267 RepID=UPI001375EF0B|nr:hypothetical protein [Microlunatus speluncae]